MARRRGSHARRTGARPGGRALAGALALAAITAAGAWTLTGAAGDAGPGSVSPLPTQAAPPPAPSPRPAAAASPAPATTPSAGPTPARAPTRAQAPAPERAARVAAASRSGKAPAAQARRGSTRPAVADREALAADEVVRRTNEARRAAGCAPLRVDPRLAAAAREHSADMARRDYFDHTSPEGTGFDDRQEAQGYPDPGAENIAVGHDSAAAVVAHWLRSTSHREVILNCDFTRIGVGFSVDGRYWTQEFGY